MSGSITSSRRLIRPLNMLLRTMVFVGVVWLFLVGVFAQSRTTTSMFHKHHYVDEVTVGRGKFVTHPKMDLNYMSKRKVPNGPDPIHNRRAGNSRKPPRQA